MADNPLEFGKGRGRAAPDGRLDAAAFHRNHAPIGAVLERFLSGRSGDVLEFGSGTGQHVVHFARHMPDLIWHPSDIDEAHLGSIDAWRTHAGLANVRPPLRIDLSDPHWAGATAVAGLPSKLTAVFCANVIHISPWRVAQGLFDGAGRHLADRGQLFLYGPFKRHGQHTASSNAAFDASLRATNAEWGVRDIADLEPLAAAGGLVLQETVEMPANNLILVFAKA